jgi:hypothetical protein
VIRFSRHARNRLRYWELSPDEVASALNEPDATVLDRRGRTNAWKRTSQGWLRVTYIDEGTTRVVVTVVLRQRGP